MGEKGHRVTRTQGYGDTGVPSPPLVFPRGAGGTVTWQPSPRGWWGTTSLGWGRTKGGGGYMKCKDMGKALN